MICIYIYIYICPELPIKWKTCPNAPPWAAQCSSPMCSLQATPGLKMLQNKITHPMLQETTQIKKDRGPKANICLLQVYCKRFIFDGFVCHPLFFQIPRIKMPYLRAGGTPQPYLRRKYEGNRMSLAGLMEGLLVRGLDLGKGGFLFRFSICCMWCVCVCVCVCVCGCAWVF